MPVKKYSNADYNRAMKLYRAGLSGPQVQELTGVHKSTVQKWARQLGIVRPRSVVSLSRRDKEEVRTLYCQNRHTIYQVESITGIPYWKIFYFLKKNGLMRTKTQARRLRARKQARKHS